jgi:hypothetical protein
VREVFWEYGVLLVTVMVLWEKLYTPPPDALAVLSEIMLLVTIKVLL